MKQINLYEYTEKIMALVNPILDETELDRNELEAEIKEILIELLADLETF